MTCGRLLKKTRTMVAGLMMRSMERGRSNATRAEVSYKTNHSLPEEDRR